MSYGEAEFRDGLALIDKISRDGSPAARAKLAELKAMADTLAPAIRSLIEIGVQPLADIITDQRKNIGRLEERVAKLEGRSPDDDAMRAVEGGQ